MSHVELDYIVLSYTQYGISSLHEAAGKGSNNIIEALISWGAEIDAVSVVSQKSYNCLMSG